MDVIAGWGLDHIRIPADYNVVENEDGIEDLEQVAYWTNPRLAYSDRAINGPQLMKAMKTMQERYGVVFLFCRPAEAAAVIKDLLRGGGEPDA